MSLPFSGLRVPRAIDLEALRHCACGCASGLGYAEVEHVLSLTKPATVISAIACLEGQISALKFVQVILWSRYAPAVRRMPAELLAHIFSYIAHDTAVPRRRNWPAFSQVCRAWRDTALSCPALWTHLDVSTPRLAETMLVRSKTMPLDVVARNLTAEGSASARTLSKALDHWPRLRSLAITCPQDLFAMDVRSKFFCGTSILESLSVELIGQPRRALAYEFSPDLSTESAPALSSLRLVNCFIPWSLLSFPSIKKLYIRFDVDSAEGPTWPEMFEALAEMRNLTDLDLTCCFPWEDARDAPPVVLPHLARLNVVGSAVNFLAMMQKVTFSPDCRIEHDSSAHIDDGGDFEVLADGLSAYMAMRNRGSHVPLRSLEFICNINPTVELSLSPLLDRKATPLLRVKTAEVPLICFFSSNGHQQWADSVETLTLGGCFALMDGGFDGLHNCSSVHTLILQDKAVCQFFQHLAEVKGEAIAFLDVNFPALQNLVLRSFDVAEGDCMDTDEEEPRSADVLLDVLHRRAGLGKRMRSLRFEACTGYSKLGRGFESALARNVEVLEGWEYVSDRDEDFSDSDESDY